MVEIAFSEREDLVRGDSRDSYGSGMGIVWVRGLIIGGP